MDSKVFNKLVNHGIITHVGLDSNDFNGIDDLYKYGIATNTSSKDMYDKIVEEVNGTVDTEVEPTEPIEPVVPEEEEEDTQADDIIVDENDETE
jgi:hypothetical protein